MVKTSICISLLPVHEVFCIDKNCTLLPCVSGSTDAPHLMLPLDYVTLTAQDPQCLYSDRLKC
jgi:hypothetical protein